LDVKVILSKLFCFVVKLSKENPKEIENQFVYALFVFIVVFGLELRNNIHKINLKLISYISIYSLYNLT